MKDEPFDNAHFLGLLGDVYDSLVDVAIACVFLGVILQPGFCRGEVACVLIFVECLDACAANGNRNDADGDIGHAVCHGAAEPVCNRNGVATVKQRGHGGVDFA